MRKMIFFLLVVLCLVQPTLAASLPQDDWGTVAPGIEFRVFRLPDPNNVFVARMERINSDVTIESSIAHGGLSGSVETVSSMAAHAEQAINYWGSTFITPTWGARNDVVVAINGSYFDWDTLLMTGGMIHSGWYAKRYEDLGGRTGFGWTLNRVPFIGECVYHKPEKNIAAFPESESSMEINGVNEPRNVDELVMYTPQYDLTTLTNDKGVEVLVEMTRPTMILPAPNIYAKGYVREIRLNAGDTPIPFDHIVLSASGNMIETLLANVSLNTEVRISQEITSLESDCRTSLDLNWIKTFSAVQGDYYFLKDEVINPYSDNDNAIVRNPRTAIAYNDEYIFFVVVDGRDVVNSVGMTIAELAAFTKDYLRATYGVAQDGGGSSTMVINGEVVNNVYCNNSYNCLDEIPSYRSYLPFVVQKVTPDLLAQQAVSMVDQVLTYERAVPNGMMMVIVQQSPPSTKFTIGQSVTLAEKAYLYSGPGTNFHRITELSAGTTGVIVDSLSGLNGVQARWANWWRVEFPNLTGWVQENVLTGKQFK